MLGPEDLDPEALDHMKSASRSIAEVVLTLYANMDSPFASPHTMLSVIVSLTNQLLDQAGAGLQDGTLDPASFYPPADLTAMPTCFRCGRNADEIKIYQDLAHDANVTIIQYIHHHEGTYNPAHNTFACDECYLAVGQPTAPFPGWRAPPRSS